MRRCLPVFLLLLTTITSAQKKTDPVVEVRVVDSKFQFVNKATRLPINSQLWDEVDPFVNGFSRVFLNNRFSFVSLSGKMIAPVEFEDARNFSNKFAAVKKDDKWGFINESGKTIFPLEYDIVFDFDGTTTAVYNSKKWWLINNKGEIIKPLDISVCYGFKNGIAKITKDEQEGVLYPDGKIVFSKVKPVVNNVIPYHPNTTNLIAPCPDNISFEYGDFTNWQCYTGQVDSVGNVNVITVNPSAPTPNRHVIYPRSFPSALDPYGLFPTNPPDGSNFAVKLGNTNVGAEAERITYTIHVPLNDSNFSIKYNYAVVLQDPGHTIWTQPRFNAKLIDSITGLYIDCASFEYISTSGLPGFKISTVNSSVIYKEWSSVFYSLRGYGGQTLYLEFTTADCVRRAHWGYAYVDVESTCGSPVEVHYDCTFPNATTLTGPPGFEFYNWWDQTFSTLLGTGQQLNMNPGPAINSIIWLEMIPFNNFGCKDTLLVNINGDFDAVFDMSADNGCAPQTFTFYNRNLPSLTTIWDFGDGNTGTGDTVTHTYSTPGTYNVTLNVTVPGGCNGTALHPITIYPTPSVVKPPGQILCNGAVTNTVNFAGTPANTVFNWTNDNPSIGLAASGTGDIPAFTAINTGNTIITATITVTPVHLTCSGPPESFTITIKPSPDVVQPANQNLCHNTSTTAVNFTGSLTGTSFSWTNNNTAIGLAASGNGNIPAFTAVNTGNTSVTATITVVPTADGCPGSPQSFTITVKPIPDVVQPVNQVLCNTYVSNPIVFTGGVSGTTYSWVNNNPSIGLAASGNGNIPAFTAINSGTAAVIANITVTPSASGCPGNSRSFIIRVNPTPDVVQPLNQILCNGASTNMVTFSGLISTTTYSWTNNNISIGLPSNGSGNIPVFTAINTGNTQSVATITVTPSVNGCPGSPKIFTISVNPTPDANQPADQTLCNAASSANVIFSGSVSGTIYNWTNNNTSIGLAASGSGNIPAFTAVNNGSASVTAVITVTPTAAGCPGNPKSFTIKVFPTPTVIQPQSQTLCNGSVTDAILFAGTVSGTTFSWTNDNTSIGLAANGNGGIAPFTAINNSNTSVTATITVTPTVGGCPGNPETFTITVNPVPTINQPANQILCNGNLTNAVAFTGPVSNTTCTWVNNNTSIGLAASGIGNIPAFTAINTGNTPITATITVNHSAAGCAGPATIFTITVNPIPDVVQPPNQVLCSGNTSNTINFSGSVSNALYSWTNTEPSIGMAANGTGNIPAFTVINTGNNPVTATITVTPSANGCPGTPEIFTITVNPTPDAVPPADQNICNGETSNAISFTGSLIGTAYNWTNTNTSIGLAAGGTGNIPAFTAVNSGNSSVIAAITVSPTLGSCTGDSKTFYINVHPTPVVNATNNSNVCLGSSIQLNATGASDYYWSPADSLSCANCANPVATPTNDILYTVRGVSSFGCEAYDSVRLTIIRPFQMIISPNDTLCIGESTNLSAAGADNYLWSPPQGLNRTDIANPTAKPNATTLYRVVGYDNYNCFTDTSFVKITVGPIPTVNIGADLTVSTGTVINLNPVIQNGPIINWSWTPSTGLSCADCPTPSLTVTDNIYYKLTVTNEYGCTATDLISIFTFCKSAQVFIPNAFTPDGDGLNDVLMVRGKGIFVKTFRIFNRWGELVFEKTNFNPNDTRYGWDGRVRGVPATPDVFVYTAEIICDNGIIYTYKGNSTLLK